MTLFATAVLAALAAQPALAQRRSNKPFNAVNGRTTTSAPASHPRALSVTRPGGGSGANAVSFAPGAAQAPAVTTAMIEGAPVSGGRQFAGSGRAHAARASGSRAVRRGGKPFWGGSRRVAEGDSTSTEEAPPNFDKPGALIRTSGQQPKYEKAEDPRTHTVDAGAIVMNNRRAHDVGRAPSVQRGPKDTLPPPNPGTGGYTTGAAANSSSSSSGSGSSTGHDNNGSGNNGKDKPGDDEDPHGGSDPFADPTGFNAAF